MYFLTRFQKSKSLFKNLSLGSIPYLIPLLTDYVFDKNQIPHIQTAFFFSLYHIFAFVHNFFTHAFVLVISAQQQDRKKMRVLRIMSEKVL